MKSSIVKRSVVIDGQKTSVSLEEPFWTGLKQIALAQHMSLSELVTQIDDARTEQSILGDPPICSSPLQFGPRGRVAQ
jgi:predicted DNA-binding ribbon-helix-helix protein